MTTTLSPREQLLAAEFAARTVLDDARANGSSSTTSSAPIEGIDATAFYTADVGYEYRRCYTAEPLTRLQVLEMLEAVG